MTFVSDLILMSIATRSNQQQLITGRFGRVGLCQLRAETVPVRSRRTPTRLKRPAT